MKIFNPKISILVIILFLSLSAVIMVSKRNEHTSTNSSASGSPYRSDNPTLAANAEKTGNIGQYYDGTKSATASASATPIPTPPSLNTYKYPGAKIKSQASSKLELDSSDSAEKITDWYKKKINELNFNAKSFAQTNTNGDILNKLSAAKPGEKLDITIKKDQSTSNVSIVVDRS